MIRIDENYTDFRDDNDPNYPGGKAIDASTPESIDGTPILAKWMNCTNGFRQAVFQKAFGSLDELSGNPDHANNSDTVNAIQKMISDMVLEAQLASNTWLASVNTVADLPFDGLDSNKNYLCKVLNDPDYDNNIAWQLIAGESDWKPFGAITFIPPATETERGGLRVQSGNGLELEDVDKLRVKLATPQAAGAMSAQDKARLDEIDSFFVNFEELALEINRRRYSIGSVLRQLPNTKSPNEDGFYGIWSDCTHSAYAYRLRSTPLPNFVTYTPGANYAVNAVVMWHLTGEDWGIFRANRAVTNAPWQLNPIAWDHIQEGEVIEQRFLHRYTDDDFAIGQELTSGDYAGYFVEEILVYGGKYFAGTGGNRPTFASGTAGDGIRNFTGRFDTLLNASQVTAIIGSWGVFSRSSNGQANIYPQGIGQSVLGNSHLFDPSMVVPTGTENAPRTVSVRYWRRVA